MAQPRKPRRLTDEEEALWKKVADSANPLSSTAYNAPTNPVEKSVRSVPKPPESKQIGSFHAGQTTRGVHHPPPHPAPELPPAMDHKAFRRMKGGRIAPEARIDLHGLTLAQAQPRLTRFILDGVDQRRRLVLVITGKGRGSPDDGPLPTRPGALRHTVPHWLHTAPLAPHVLQIAEAHRRHGGQGAYYVYLRRRR